MSDALPRPPFDAELAVALPAFVEQIPQLTVESLAQLQREPEPPTDEIDGQMKARGLTRREVTIAGHRGDHIGLSVIQRHDHIDQNAAIYYMHGGGMIVGGRLDGVLALVDWVAQYDAVVVTVEYRLAPEFPDPYPVEDCYAGLSWTAEHAHELAIDPGRVLVCGMSAGGGLAAGTALLARDRQGPQLLGQLLMYPMLDDRDNSLSTRQIDGVGVWDRQSNAVGWTALLGDRKGTDEVSIYAAPSRATDLSGLPSAYIDCGSAEVFRDEDVAYATALWAAGVQAELHVWAGGFHGFEAVVDAAVSRAAVAARDTWVDRLLSS